MIFGFIFPIWTDFNGKLIVIADMLGTIVNGETQKVKQQNFGMTIFVISRKRHKGG